MSDEVFSRLKVEVLPPAKKGSFPRAIFAGTTNSNLMNAHIRGLMNVATQRGLDVRSNYKYKCERDERGAYQYRTAGTVYFRDYNMSTSFIQSMLELGLLQAEIIWNMIMKKPQEQWALLHRHYNPKERFE